MLNLARRHMSTSARRGLIRAKLVADPSKSDRAIATAIGVDHKTVGTVRKELEQSGKVGKFPTLLCGGDGRPHTTENLPAGSRNVAAPAATFPPPRPAVGKR